MAPTAKQDRIIKQLEDDGYEEGPGASNNVTLREGDILTLGFRGNIKPEEENTALNMIFNSHLTASLKTYVIEVDKFLQKSYNVYRGFVQVNRRRTVIIPPKKDDSEEVKEPREEFRYDLIHEHVISIPKVIFKSTCERVYLKGETMFNINLSDIYVQF